jgi:hypothetical protein
MRNEIATKSEFARIAGVSAGRVSQWVTAGKIAGDAIVGSGHRARIRVAVAMEQLSRSLDVVQGLGANGRAMATASRATTAAKANDRAGARAFENGLNESNMPDTVEANIKAERLRQLALSNAKATAEEAMRSGRYTLADAARQETGRALARVLAVFEAALGEFANAIVAERPATQRDALRTLRAAWRAVRARQAKATGAEASAMQALVEDESPTVWDLDAKGRGFARREATRHLCRSPTRSASRLKSSPRR